RERVVEAAECFQRAATIAVRGDGLWVDREGGVDQANRAGMVALLMPRDPQEMQAVEVIGLRRDNLAVDDLGVGNAAGAVQRHRLGECRSDIERASGRGLLDGFLLPRPHRLCSATRARWPFVAESNQIYHSGRCRIRYSGAPFLMGETEKLCGASPRCCRSHMAT